MIEITEDDIIWDGEDIRIDCINLKDYEIKKNQISQALNLFYKIYNKRLILGKDYYEDFQVVRSAIKEVADLFNEYQRKWNKEPAFISTWGEISKFISDDLLNRLIASEERNKQLSNSQENKNE